MVIRTLLGAASALALAGVAHAHDIGASLESGRAALENNDFLTAALTFDEAFRHGDADAGYELANMAHYGLGLPQDGARAAILYRAAADAGSTRAMVALGLMYLAGDVVGQNAETGATLLCAAAEAGDAEGAFQCGVVTARGIGVTRNLATAAAFYALAAEEGHTTARTFLGLAYRDGVGVFPEPARAQELLFESAREGDATAAYALAEMRADADDRLMAHILFSIAAEGAHPKAEARLLELQAEMTADDILDAQERARAWRAGA